MSKTVTHKKRVRHTAAQIAAAHEAEVAERVAAALATKGGANEGTRDPNTFSYDDLAATVNVALVEADARIVVLTERIAIADTERANLYRFCEGARIATNTPGINNKLSTGVPSYR